jgi:small conductance mechanosensitive channel
MMRIQDQESTNAANEATVANGEEAEGLLANLDTGVAIDLATGYGIPAIKALLIVLVAWVVAAWVRRLTRQGMDRAKIEPTITTFTSNLARWAVLAIAAVFILGVFGIETATVAVVFGGLALAIGLALQGTLGNAAAGFMLLIFRPFKVGDFISTGGVSGTVVEIELFSTSIDTPDKRRLIVPNGSIFGSTIENVSHHAVRRVDVAVGVAYDADLVKTRQVLLEAATSVEEGLEDPAPAIVLSELGDSSVNWTVRLWVNSSDFWPARDKLTERVKNALDAAGLSIPFPQMDVYLKGNMPGSAG